MSVLVVRWVGCRSASRSWIGRLIIPIWLNCLPNCRNGLHSKILFRSKNPDIPPADGVALAGEESMMPGQLALGVYGCAVLFQRAKNGGLSCFCMVCSTTRVHCSHNCWQVARSTGASSGRSARIFKCRSMTAASLTHTP